MVHPPTRLLVISGAEIMRLVDPVLVVEALADGFKALSRGEVQAPPRPQVHVPGKGFSLAMLAWAPGRRIALKTVNVYHGNHAQGLASHQALVSLFDADTGVALAVLDGSSLTGIRTAAAAMLSIRTLARPDAQTALVVGAGVQALEHIRQLHLTCALTEIRVFARDLTAAARLASTISNGKPVTDLEAAVRTSDIICLTTSSPTPVIEDHWVQPGTHVTSVGYTPPGSELPPALVDRAALFVEAMSAFQATPVGCAELAGRDPLTGAELGQVLLGDKPGRTSAQQITLYKSMGNAMEDMVAANLAYEAAVATGVRQTIEL